MTDNPLFLSSDRVLHSMATKAGIAGFPSLIAMHISIIFIGTGEFPLFSNYSASIDICFYCFRAINQWRPEQMDSKQAWCCCCGNRVRGWKLSYHSPCSHYLSLAFFRTWHPPRLKEQIIWSASNIHKVYSLYA